MALVIQTQTTKNSAVTTAKNYLEQEMEVSGNKSRIITKNHEGMILFQARDTIVATLQGNMLHIFHESTQIGDINVPNQVETINVEKIQKEKALYCSKENKWMSFSTSLRRCRCHAYLKVRTRFFEGPIPVEDSSEMAEIAAAKQDIRNAQKTEKVLRASSKLPSVGLSTQVIGASALDPAIEGIVSTESFFIERVSLKVNGQIIEDERKFQPLLELTGVGQ